jgi:hypothetical protein
LTAVTRATPESVPVVGMTSEFWDMVTSLIGYVDPY